MRLFPRDLSGRQRTTLKISTYSTKLTTFWASTGRGRSELVISSTEIRRKRRGVKPASVRNEAARSLALYRRGRRST